ncbi:hypothetical protein LOC67_03300 [Stieleria sp. JC731]|uniref:hypothetical protein n=1 Tax=Pirellulaceae TaxID=2691357 RepID=UPI001E5C066D|nr:hypothetical protein [Stieleria sp. JC731]MCC9599574.1 hypothetical protein [Stieleria sp. JC731]
MNRSPHDISNDQRQRCLAYLLGEMDANEQLAFEADLDDESLQNALIRESELLCQIASSTALDTAATSTNSHLQDTAHLQPATQPAFTVPASDAPTAAIANQRLVLMLAALAAGLLLVISIFNTDRSRQDDFELQLATEWANRIGAERMDGWPAAAAIDSDSNSDVALIALPDLAAVAPSVTDGNHPEDLFADNGSGESDESIDWMVLAMEDNLLEDDRNDG